MAELLTSPTSPMTSNLTPRQAFILLLFTLLTLLFLSSCTTTKYVPIETTITHTEHTRDTITLHDTLQTTTTTIIRELDSTALSQYGIRLANQQRAFLIDRTNLQREITNLRTTHQQATHDTIQIPIPYEVTKEVSAKLTRWQSFTMTVGHITITLLTLLLILYISYLIFKKNSKP